SDLREHARAVIDTGKARVVTYDMRDPDDLLWGLGTGCEGAMDIVLLRAGPANDWQPLTHLAGAWGAHASTAAGIVVGATLAAVPACTVILPTHRAQHPSWARALSRGHFDQLLHELARARTAGFLALASPLRVFALPLALPPRILILGAGPDAVPVASFAAQ